jgi:hypothetical protein
MKRALAVVALVGLLAGCSSTPKPIDPSPVRSTAASRTAAPNPYAGYVSGVYHGTDHWVCSPLLPTDPCRHISETVLESDGSTHAGDLASATDPGVDCFYVYPTVSEQRSVNADLTIDSDVKSSARTQAGPFSSVCRVFAPVYRQITLPGLDSAADTNTGQYTDQKAADRAYQDVLDAWKTYMAEDNHGRRVVLFGHSQGAFMLKRLLHEEIEPRPAVRALLLSSILLGGAVLTGELTSPTCTSDSQLGCYIAYESYPSTGPPSVSSLFGRAPTNGQSLVCVNPAALGGGTGVADTLSPAGSVPVHISTAFLSLPGAFQMSCQKSGSYGYLSVSPASAGDQRPVRTILDRATSDGWGLHGIDPDLTMGTLLKVVASESAAAGK